MKSTERHVSGKWLSYYIILKKGDDTNALSLFYQRKVEDVTENIIKTMKFLVKTVNVE